MQGKRPSTIETYCARLQTVLYDLHDNNIRKLSDLKSQDIYAVFEKSRDKLNFSTYVKSFLKYLFNNGLNASDLSLIVPSMRRPKLVPSIYSDDEINLLLSEIDRKTLMGMRDYAVVLLAWRLGMRSGDILNLKIDNINFEARTIEFTQQKTLVPQRLELLPEIEDALFKYLSNDTNRYGSPYIFLSLVAPYNPLAKCAVNNIVNKYFKKANIDTKNRKHGGHALRMTLASELVAENVPYDVVRKIMGHEDPESIQRYVKFDIKMLRRCALEVPLPTGLLAEKLLILGGEVQ